MIMVIPSMWAKEESQIEKLSKNKLINEKLDQIHLPFIALPSFYSHPSWGAIWWGIFYISALRNQPTYLPIELWLG